MVTNPSGRIPLSEAPRVSSSRRAMVQSFGERVIRRWLCMALDDQHLEGGISINADKVGVGVGNQPGGAALHPAASSWMQLRMQQPHDRREANPSPAGESPLRKPRPSNQVGEAISKMEAR